MGSSGWGLDALVKAGAPARTARSTTSMTFARERSKCRCRQPSMITADCKQKLGWLTERHDGWSLVL